MFHQVRDWPGVYAGLRLVETVDRALAEQRRPLELAAERTWARLAAAWLPQWHEAGLRKRGGRP
jgi:hypothetical protein